MIHIHRAQDQPATRFVDWHGPTPITTRLRRRHQLRCVRCKQKRWATNLFVHVYYDCTLFFCRPGRGCMATR